MNKGDPSKNRSDEINQALRLAVNENNFEITRILLDWGADPNVRDMAGVPLIISPLMRNNELLLHQLLLKGADVNTRDKNGYTLLMRAIILGKANFVRILIKSGKDLVYCVIISTNRCRFECFTNKWLCHGIDPCKFI